MFEIDSRFDASDTSISEYVERPEACYGTKAVTVVVGLIIPFVDGVCS
jgi:hypothetical protein